MLRIPPAVPTLLVLLLLLFPLSSLSAQAIRGRLVSGATGAPLPGAFVVLLDEEGTQVQGTLSDERGGFLLEAPAAGRYRLRAERIGYRSTLSPWLALAADQTLPYRLEAAEEAIRLEGIVATGEQRCELRPEQGRQTATLWEEARKALAVSAWTEAQGVLRYRTVKYERTLEPERLGVLEERRGTKSAYHRGSPFVSIPAERLAEGGYIQPVGAAGELMYYAPDARVLLSDTFLDTHCFRVQSEGAPEAGLVGLAFAPAERREQADVRGVLWLKRATAELKSLDYRYTELPAGLQSEQVGGRVEFTRVPTGPWIVQRWRIRSPVVGLRRVGLGAGPHRTEAVLIEVWETGGEVVAVRDVAGNTLLETDRATPTARLAEGEIRKQDLAIALPQLASAPDSVITLEGVTAVGMREAELRERAAGHSHRSIVTRADIEQYVERGARDIGEALRMHESLGIDIAALIRGPNIEGQCIRSSRAFPQRAAGAMATGGQTCAMVELVVDGVRIEGAMAPRFLQTMQLSEIESIEYLPPTESTFRYGTMNGAGTVVIETRRGWPRDG